MGWRELPIDNLELSIRAVHCLHNAEIRTLGELVLHPEWYLMTIENFGRRSLSELKELLASYGLQLGMGPQDEQQISAYAEPEPWTTQPGDLRRLEEYGEEELLRRLAAIAPPGYLISAPPVSGHPRSEHAVWLRFVERATYKEIGLHLGCSAERARQLTWAGVRRAYRREYGRPSGASLVGALDYKPATLEGEPARPLED